MSKVFVISDLHLGHNNMALKRGFSSAEEQDQTIIDKWNSVVKKNDIVWILGDISMNSRYYHLLDQLKGNKKVVLGNHDLPKYTPSLMKHVNSVCGCYAYKSLLLTHVPVHLSEINYRFKKNVHGHTHDKVILDPRYVNVCCEKVDYTPVEMSKYL